LKPSARIEGNLEFEESGERIVDATYQRTFAEELTKAIATAK
jgi:hypothetical protein